MQNYILKAKLRDFIAEGKFWISFAILYHKSTFKSFWFKMRMYYCWNCWQTAKYTIISSFKETHKNQTWTESSWLKRHFKVHEIRHWFHFLVLWFLVPLKPQTTVALRVFAWFYMPIMYNVLVKVSKSLSSFRRGLSLPSSLIKKGKIHSLNSWTLEMVMDHSKLDRRHRPP